MSRGTKIYTNNHEYGSSEKVNWLDEFAANYAKSTAVEVARQRHHSSMFDQINSIMNGNQLYATVDDAVQDMQERTGLKTYLNRISKKVASEEVEPFAGLAPELKNAIVSFCKNKIATKRGLLSIPEVQYDILATFKNQGIAASDINCEAVSKYVSDLILDEQKRHSFNELNNVNIGKGVGVVDIDNNDSDNTDFLKGLMPNKE